VSIAKSEVLSGLLKKRNVPHDVLNAKQHEREAEIVAQAGRKGRLTISTNMAGRGTDILLGGNPEFLAKREAGQEPNPEEIEGRLVQERVAKAKKAGRQVRSGHGRRGRGRAGQGARRVEAALRRGAVALPGRVLRRA